AWGLMVYAGGDFTSIGGQPRPYLAEFDTVCDVAFQTDGTPGATLTGATPQSVRYGEDCTMVRANTPRGYPS
ncbi:MAG: hypothetical protein NTW86_26945, partial [Candidatus Sumerlaeota bacterium]|nr:hypothetical protein [Candidatus Sumerlaeota bacterium]